MAYELHIERREGIISLVEWESAIAKVAGIRLNSGGYSVTNPETEEVISFPGSAGNAETYSPTDKTWNPTFYWSNGKISFKAMPLPDDASNHVWLTATALAAWLNAEIRGDEGETYDLKTAKVLE